ncbi:cytochrome P450 3A29-like [Ptychodera flava]|uniref:cytochrome P450 3A29-like n=1 Tax=Ptychodera flava TaxID=63121 RepID=UPI00396A82C1
MYNMDIFGLSLTLWLVILGAVLLYVYGTWTFSTFSSQGIPGPKPLLLVGSFFSLMKGFPQKLLEYNQEYGRLYGMFLGRSPSLVVSDADMLKEILVKQFNNFHIRRKAVVKIKPISNSIIDLYGPAWKYARNVLTPTFSGSKMREMSKTIDHCTDTLVNNLQKNVDAGTDVDMKITFGCFSMDCIAGAAFGLEVDSQNNPDDPFVTNMRVVLNLNVFNPKLLLLVFFPSLGKLYDKYDISVISPKAMNFFSEVTEQAMNIRQSEAGDTKHIDFLQLMLNAHKDFDEVEMPDEDHLTDKDIGYFKERGLTNPEIIGNAFVFFFAGYETTSTCLACTAYLLAVNPDAQDKIISEIDSIMENHDELNYAALQEMSYLDMVISESLRLYPPTVKSDRLCTQSCTINGVHVQKDMRILIPIYAIHMDPDYWPDPNKFIPERFTKEEKEKRNPYTWLPFGNGPRNCIGMRFALMEVKLALVRVLQKFKFEPCEKTQV